jgi:oleandomycin transport system permease protein
VFGGAISGGTHRYLQFELPGILVLSVVFATLGTGLMLNQDIASGVFDRFRSLPIARWAPLAGAVLGDMVRYMISVAITLGFGMILGFRVTASALSAFVACLLVLAFALAMCWLSALIGMLAKTPQGVQWFGSATGGVAGARCIEAALVEGAPNSMAGPEERGTSGPGPPRYPGRRSWSAAGQPSEPRG